MLLEIKSKFGLKTLSQSLKYLDFDFKYFIDNIEDNDDDKKSENEFEMNFDPFMPVYKGPNLAFLGKFSSHHHEKTFYLNLSNFAKEIESLDFYQVPNYASLIGHLQKCKKNFRAHQ